MSVLKTFGRNPTGAELQKVKASPNYKHGQFKNLSPTALMAKGVSMPKMMWHFINKPANCYPSRPLPAIKIDLKNLPAGEPVIVWFGHSSYLVRINNKNILVDPVFSGHASPFSFAAKSFDGANAYSVDDMPGIDILLITHDHYDHLDYETVIKLQPKVKQVCTSLGVASHLVYWGYNKDIIHEFDWWDSKVVYDDITFIAAPARHFSGRSLTRNKTLWSSFILKTGTHTLYLGGDSGYDTHFKTIGQRFGPFDIALLECGQYNTAWPDIHMLPPQTVQAAIDLNTKMLLPVHWGKFSLSMHPWYEPAEIISAEAARLQVPITTPMIGQPVVIGKQYPTGKWWENVMTEKDNKR